MRLTDWLEMLGGARQPPLTWNRFDFALVRAFWWVALFLAAWAFAGRNTKFIYVDF
jgi:hypothetical protein